MKYQQPSIVRVRMVGEMGASPSWCHDGFVCLPEKE